MSIGIITQARMGSTRLAGKILKPVGSQTMLDYHIQRLQASGIPLYLATTTLPEDNVLVDYAQARSIPCFRGDSADVLSRYYGTAQAHGLTTIVRVTSDCPLLDGELIRSGVELYERADNPRLYVSNGLVRTYPRGLDFEIFSFELLAEAQQHATSLSDREHVTPYIHQNRSGRVTFAHVARPQDASRFRITLDTAEDLKLLQILLEQYQAATLSAEELITLLEAHPELVALNAEIEQKRYDFSK